MPTCVSWFRDEMKSASMLDLDFFLCPGLHMSTWDNSGGASSLNMSHVMSRGASPTTHIIEPLMVKFSHLIKTL